jgi:hypothetical protein
MLRIQRLLWRTKNCPYMFVRSGVLAQTRRLSSPLSSLFITSYTLVDFLRDNDWFGAKRAVISSASSKTAYGAAFCLKDSGLGLIGLTSARNSAFVERLGCYQSTVEYQALEGSSRMFQRSISTSPAMKRCEPEFTATSPALWFTIASPGLPRIHIFFDSLIYPGRHRSSSLQPSSSTSTQQRVR